MRMIADWYLPLILRHGYICDTRRRLAQFLASFLVHFCRWFAHLLLRAGKPVSNAYDGGDQTGAERYCNDGETFSQ